VILPKFKPERKRYFSVPTTFSSATLSPSRLPVPISYYTTALASQHLYRRVSQRLCSAGVLTGGFFLRGQYRRPGGASPPVQRQRRSGGMFLQAAGFARRKSLTRDGYRASLLSDITQRGDRLDLRGQDDTQSGQTFIIDVSY